MKIGNPNRISVDVQARINHPPIPMVREVKIKVKEYDMIKMLQDPASATSETYKLKCLRSKTANHKNS